MDEQQQADKLALFQSLTGSSNLEECLMFLESSNWDVEKSVQLFYEDLGGTSTNVAVDGMSAPSSLQSTTQIPTWMSKLVGLVRSMTHWGLAMLLRIGRPISNAIMFNTRRYASSWIGPDYDRFDPTAAANRFLLRFEEAYGTNRPPFYQGAYVSAIQQAKEEHRFLLVYLHSHEHQDSQLFCRNVLTSNELIHFINEHQLLVWAGDVSEPEAFQVSGILGTFTFPFSALLSFHNSRLMVISRNEGSIDPIAFRDWLRGAIENLEPMLIVSRGEREERDRNRRLREEQDAAYQTTLLADQEREKKQLEERERKRQEQTEIEQKEKERTQKLQIKRREQSEKRIKFNQEPDITDSNLSKLVFRLPDGSRIERRFRHHEPIQVLYDFVETLPEMESISSFDLYSNFPRQSYSGKKHLNLLEANLIPSAIIVVEEQTDD